MEDRARPKVLLCLSGSVAVVKAPQLAVMLAEFAEVKIIVTEASKHFLDRSEAYNGPAHAEFASLDPPIPVLGDADEWEAWDAVGVVNGDAAASPISVSHYSKHRASHPPPGLTWWRLDRLDPARPGGCGASASQVGRLDARGPAVRQHPGEARQRVVRQPCDLRGPSLEFQREETFCRCPRHEHAHVGTPDDRSASVDLEGPGRGGGRPRFKVVGLRGHRYRSARRGRGYL